VWNAQVLLRELRERNYGGGYSILTEWLRPQRKEALSVAVRRFETPPGKQAQVDWGHLGSIAEGGEARMLWGFTITLGYLSFNSNQQSIADWRPLPSEPAGVLHLRHDNLTGNYHSLPFATICPAGFGA